MPGTSALQKRTVANRPDDVRYRTIALANILGRTYDPMPATNPSPPTIAHSSSTTLTRIWSPQLLLDRAWAGSLRGAFGTWNQGYGRVDFSAKPITLDFWVTDTQVEVDWTEAAANGTRIWTWVDGVPAEAPPTAAPLTTTGGTTYSTLLTWSTRGRHRVTMNLAGINSLYAIRTNITGWIAAANRRPRIAMIGDSYLGGSTNSAPPNAYGDVFARTLDVDMLNEGVGGTGYANPGPPNTSYGAANRVANVKAFRPDLIVFNGSINDQGYSTSTLAAATSTYAAYAAACPGVPQIVFGVQPTNATNSFQSTMAVAANAVYQAAMAARNVIAFFDEVGYAATGTIPATFAGYSTYATGTLVYYQGAIYKYLGATGNVGPNAPTANGNWELQTWGYTGTGNAGSPAGDGTRDVILSSDNTHPTTEGAYFIGLSKADAVVRALRAYAGQQP